MVCSARVHVPLPHLVVHESGQRLEGAHAVVLSPLLLLRAPSVHPDSGKALHALLLACLLKVDAVDLQHADVCSYLVRVVGSVLPGVDPVLELLPRAGEVLAVRAPVRVEVDHGEVVRINDRLEVVMLEVVARGAPVSIKLRKFLLGEALVGEFQFHELILTVRMPLMRPFVVDPLLGDVTGDVHALRPKSIPDAHSHEFACHIEHLHVEVDS
mmetsp:Transcript_41308/g.95641  ORF Transcript_41308/g.95641 Transcript_41308/m.95641 type:complete len:213 (+) Transcript_41308:663-1301(+)